MTQQDFQQEQSDGEPCPHHVVVLGVGEVAYIHLGLFEMVDFSEDVLQHVVARSAEIFSARG